MRDSTPTNVIGHCAVRVSSNCVIGLRVYVVVQHARRQQGYVEVSETFWTKQPAMKELQLL